MSRNASTCEQLRTIAPLPASTLARMPRECHARLSEPRIVALVYGTSEAGPGLVTVEEVATGMRYPAQLRHLSEVRS